MIAPYMTRVTLTSVQIFLAVLLASFALPGQQLVAASLRNISRTTEQFQGLPLIRTSQNHLLVRAVINDKPAVLIVDTGSPGTVISSKRKSYFGLTTAPASMNWPSRVQVNGAFSNLVIARSLRLGGLNVVDVPVVLANMRGTNRTADQQIDGILGADVLFGTKAVLDCHRQTLIISMYPEMSSHVPGLDLRGYQ